MNGIFRLSFLISNNYHSDKPASTVVIRSTIDQRAPTAIKLCVYVKGAHNGKFQCFGNCNNLIYFMLL